MSERKRSPNWHMSEKIVLVDLVTKHYNIIENKKTDGISMKRKQAEWVKISDEFNARPETLCHRTAQNLKATWERLKKTTKREACVAKKGLIQTGDGPPKLNDPLFDRIIRLISTSVIELQDPLDNDNTISDDVIIEEYHQDKPTCVKICDDIDIYFQCPIRSNCMSVTSKTSDEQESISSCTYKEPQGGGIAVDKNDSPKPNEELGSGNKKPQIKPKILSCNCRPLSPTSSDTQDEFYVADEREDAKKLFEIELQIKKEKLKQEKIKTRLLLTQLHRKKIRRN